MTVFSFTHEHWWICGDVRRAPVPQRRFVADSAMTPGLTGYGDLMTEAVKDYQEGIEQWIQDNPDLRSTLVRRVKPTTAKP